MSTRSVRPEMARALRDCLTEERLESYLRACEGDLERALQLYEWNMHAAAGVLHLTSMVEVVVRNALDRELVRWAQTKGSSCWFDLIPLDDRGRVDLAKARGRARRGNEHREVHGRVIAELSLGFWRYLVESRYLTALWVPATHRASPFGSPDVRERQRAVSFHLQQLNFVRNRAAHHEPIHRRPLRRELGAAQDLAGWVHPAAGDWIVRTTTLPAVLTTRPDVAR